MSASLSLVNDTPHPYHCKFLLKQDAPLLKWGTIATTVVATVTATLAISPALTIRGLGVFGVPEKYLAMDGAAPTVKGIEKDPSSSKFGAVLADSIANHLKDKGYMLLMPGERKRTVNTGINQKLFTDCKKISSGQYTILNTLSRDTVTGATNGSDIDYSLAKWEKDSSPQQIMKIEKLMGHSTAD